jgi:hypothetical protein
MMEKSHSKKTVNVRTSKPHRPARVVPCATVRHRRGDREGAFPQEKFNYYRSVASPKIKLLNDQGSEVFMAGKQKPACLIKHRCYSLKSSTEIGR